MDKKNNIPVRLMRKLHFGVSTELEQVSDIGKDIPNTEGVQCEVLIGKESKAYLIMDKQSYLEFISNASIKIPGIH